MESIEIGRGPSVRPLTFQLLEASHCFQRTGTYAEERALAVDMQAGNPNHAAMTLAITGMTCGGCARTIERVLSRVPGVTAAAADHELGIAIVNGSASPSTLATAVKAAGYAVTSAGLGA